MKLVYVAGPFRGKNSWEVENNIRKAEQMGFEIAEMGAIPIIPHTMYRFWDGTLNDEFWLACGIEMLVRCDAIFMNYGWMHSTGSKAELDFAKKQNIPDFYDLGSLKRWLMAQEIAPPASADSISGFLPE